MLDLFLFFLYIYVTMLGNSFSLYTSENFSCIQWMRDTRAIGFGSRAYAYALAQYHITNRKESATSYGKAKFDKKLFEDRLKHTLEIKEQQFQQDFLNKKIRYNEYLDKIDNINIEEERALLSLGDFFEEQGARDNKFQAKNQARTKSKIAKLLPMNIHRNGYFVTLTFEKEPQNWDEAMKLIQAFCRKLRTEIDEKLLYIYVGEFGGENGRLHVHMIIAGQIKAIAGQIKKLWKHGICDVRRIKQKDGDYNYKAVANYIAKYITKENCDAMGNRRGYYISHGWKDVYKHIEGSHEQKKQLFDKAKALMKKSGKVKHHAYQIHKDGHDYIVWQISVNKNLEKEILDMAREQKMEIEERGILRKTEEQKLRDKLQKEYWHILSAMRVGESTKKYEDKIFDLLKDKIKENHLLDFIAALRNKICPAGFLLSAGTYDNEDAINRVRENGMKEVMTDNVSINYRAAKNWFVRRPEFVAKEGDSYLTEMAEDALNEKGA